MGMTSTIETSYKLQGRSLFLARLAWVTLVGLALVIFITTFTAAYEFDLHRYPEDVLQQFGLSASLIALYRRLLIVIFYLGYVAVGLVIFLRRSNEWLAFLASLSLATYPFVFSSAPFWATSHTSPWNWSIAVLYSIMEALTFIVIFLFPDGRFVPRWTRWLAFGVGLWAIALYFLFPVGIELSVSVPLFDNTVILGGLVWFGAGLLAQIYRYRRISSAAQRQQTKWVVFSLAAAFLAWVIYVPPTIFIPALSKPDLPNLLWNLSAFSINIFALLLVPVCISFGILRYRLWDIDFIINRSLVYGVLTVLLVGLFASSLFIISQLMQDFSGGPLVAVAASASIFGAIFQPTRRRLQRFVDQHFYDIQIDYQKTPPVLPMNGNVMQTFKQTFSVHTKTWS